jgi:hypothetical protein
VLSVAKIHFIFHITVLLSGSWLSGMDSLTPICIYSTNILMEPKNCNSSVCIVTTLRAGQPRNHGFIPGRCMRFFSPQNVKTGSVADPASF